jgi:glycosyltransferase involved in cell wall biosynthesis
MLAIVTSHPIQNQAPLWRALAAAGVKFEVWFLTPHAVKASHDPEFGRTFAWDVNLLDGYPHRFIGVREGWDLNRFTGIKLVRSWDDELREHGVTTLWIEGWRFRALWDASAAAHRAGIPLWLRGESHDLARGSGWRSFLKRLFLRRLFHRVDRFLCIGTANARFYRKHGVAPERLVSAPYCVDHERFANAAAAAGPERAHWRAHWSIAPEAFVVLFCGKLIAKKNPADLVAAARAATPPPGRSWHLLFAGDGALAEAVRSGLNGAGQPAGTITGFLNQSEIPRAFAAADCLVLPSGYGETWGLVVNEALASGVDVIVSNHCGCAEDLAAPLGPQHVFPCGDVAALARALTAVAAAPSPLAARRALSEAHAPARTVTTVVALLAGKSQGPAPAR